MNPKIKKIELVSQIGTFTFAEHHNSSADFYQALLNFESNNWQLLGCEISYNVHLKFEDGIETIEKCTGNNASCFLAAYFDKEVENEINAFYQSQY